MLVAAFCSCRLLTIPAVCLHARHQALASVGMSVEKLYGLEPLNVRGGGRRVRSLKYGAPTTSPYSPHDALVISCRNLLISSVSQEGTTANTLLTEYCQYLKSDR